MSNLTIGRDGKTYMSWRNPADRLRVIELTHELYCREGLTIRETRRRLFGQHIRRSTGMIHQYLTRYECPKCSDMPEPVTRPVTRPAEPIEVFAWR